MSRNNIITIVFFCGVIAFLVGFIIRSDKQESLYQTVLYQQVQKKLTEERNVAQNKIIELQKANSILQDAYLISEKKRKANYKLYEDAVKNAPTNYNARQRFADSLSATLR